MDLATRQPDPVPGSRPTEEEEADGVTQEGNKNLQTEAGRVQAEGRSPNRVLRSQFCPKSHRDPGKQEVQLLLSNRNG